MNYTTASTCEGDMQAGFLSANVMSSKKAVEIYGSVEEAKAMGVHLILAPVLDINNNPKNIMCLVSLHSRLKTW